ncbi:MFS transporter [Nocardiopsis baichengensis]|uniref:MFS transporter n=1 Tax=Nocardiopsis baichengensis TaxID=280240 RepID=UPI00034BEC7F|nr:MFS transporter [Nocardiopsis baichengensis]
MGSDDDRDRSAEDGAEGIAWGTPAARWTLAATVLGSGMAFLDSTVVNVALPVIQDDLGTGVAGLQWIANGYMVTLSALILLGGALADRFGRVRVFSLGVASFALASALCTVAPTLELLVAGRVLQGVGGALLTPGSLAVLQSGFRKQDRAQAVGAWSGLTGVAAAVGPFLGGWLVDIGSWRLIFLINLPLAAAVLLIARRHLPESRDAQAPARMDYPGALLAILALAGISYALIEAGAGEVPAGAAALAGAVGAAALAGFALVETRSAHPMLPLGVFASARFTAANLVTVLMYGALGPLLFLLVLYLQEAAGYSALAAGAASLPITVLMLLLSGRSGRLAERIGPRAQMTAGPLLVGVGMLLLSRLTPGADYLTEVLPGVLVVGLGLSAAVAPLTATALSSAPERHAGVASGVNNTVARAAQLIGVAAVPAAAGVSGAAGIEGGFAAAMLIVAAVSVGGGLVAFVLLRERGSRMEQHKGMFCGVSGPPMEPPASSAPDAGGEDRRAE